MIFFLISAGITGVFVSPHNALASSGLPAWWSSDCGGHATDGTYSDYVTTDPKIGLEICYPSGWNGDINNQPNYQETVTVSPNTYTLPSEWQCVELSARYLLQYHNMAPPSGATGDGYALANKYYQQYASSQNISLITGGITHQLPAIGDVFSTTNGGSAGHTGVIANILSSDPTNGNATVMLVQQNESTGSGWDGFNADGTQRTSVWPNDHSYASVYTKIEIVGWNYYDHDSASYLTNPFNGVQILHFGSAPKQVSKPSIVADSSGNITAFAHTTNNQVVESTTTSITSLWSTWSLIGDASTSIVSNPVAYTATQVYARGSDRQIKQTYWSNTSGWSSWGTITTVGMPTGGFIGDPTLLTDQGWPRVLALGTDNHLYYTYVSNGSWVGWAQAGDSTPLVGSPVAYVWNQYYALGSDGQIKQTYWSSTSGWSSWGTITTVGMPAGGFMSDPTLLADGGWPRVLALGADNHLYYTYVSNGSWVGWAQAGDSAPLIGSPIAFAWDRYYALGSDRQIKQTYWSSTSGWASWWAFTTLSGGFKGNIFLLPTVSGETTGYPVVFAIGNDGNMYDNYVTTNNSNTSWQTSWLLVGSGTGSF
jgi:hypothetical protein